MRTELRDVLHFYIGCEAHVQCSEYYPEGKGRILQIDIESEVATVSANTLHDRTQYCVEADITDIKPILRKLSSMTEEEAIQVADIVIGSFDSVKWRVDKKFKIVNGMESNEFIYFDVHKKHRGYSKSLTIDDHGEIDVYDDSEITQYMHQHHVTKYLLSKSFDLFSLIESGQSIDLNQTTV